MAAERRRVHRLRTANALDDGTKDLERRKTVEDWERRWQNGGTGRWTAKLIPAIKAWISGEHVETNFYLTQLLTGHGAFNAYLNRMGLRDSLMCSYCPDETDNAQHTFFHCNRWAEDRRAAAESIGEDIHSDNLIPHMIGSKTKCEAAMKFAEEVVRGKEARTAVEQGRRLLAHQGLVLK